MSKILPNSFQTPNAYVDEFMAFLTPEEYKVLAYAARRIFGFSEKRHDHISLSQFSEGAFLKDGSRRDYGTGLGVKAVRRALSALIAFGLIIQVADNDPQTNEGACYALQLDHQRVDLAGLEARRHEQEDANRARTAKATKASPHHGKRMEAGTSDATPLVRRTVGG